MPEIPEQNTFRRLIQDFIEKIKSQSGPEFLRVDAVYSDIKDTEVKDMVVREHRLLEHASTLSQATIGYPLHTTVWATILERIAASIPDTHGLMICKVPTQSFSLGFCI
jgi:hypothetical protein